MSYLTKNLMAGVPVLVEQGWMPKPSRPDLAAQSAHSRCAAHRLRSACAYPKRSKVVPLVPQPPKPPQSKRCFAFAVLQLSKVAMSRLRQRADATGMTEDALVTDLLEVIAQDDLFDAVLDTEKGAA